MHEEQEYLDSFRSGEPQAIEKVFTLYGNRLFRAAYLLCGNESDARDIVQETFLQAIKSINRFKAKSAFYTWLYGILLNVFRNHSRKKRFLPLSSEVKNKETDSASMAENRLEQQRTFSKLYELMKLLSPAHREVLILRYYEDLKIKEIAKITGTSQGTVKSRLHYATSYLREKVPPDMNLFRLSDTNERKKK